MSNKADTLYSPPEANPEITATEFTAAPEVVVEHLRATRPWVNFCSILGFIHSFFLVIIGFIITKFFASRIEPPYTYIIAGFFVALATLLIIPAMQLSAYEKTITKLTITRDLEDLEIAMSHQQAFWKQLGQMITLLVIIYLSTMILSAYLLVNR